jgi:uncharacterized protein (UPF0333 family)
MPKPKRHRILAFFMLIPAILLFAVGWTIYFVGKEKVEAKKKNA